MKYVLCVVACAAIGWTPLASDRMTDKDIKALSEKIDQDRDRFEDQLDDNLKNSIFRSATGEVNVKRALDDFQESVKNLKDRLKPEYAASSEAATVLRQASRIDKFFKDKGPGTKGESEWNKLASDLKALAAAYGADFPLPENAPVRRMGDREVAASVDAIAKTADQLKKSLGQDVKKDTAVDPGARAAAIAEVDELSKAAKALRSRLKDGQPSSAEAGKLFATAGRIKSFLDAHQGAVASASVFGGLAPKLQALAAAYGMPGP